MPILLPALPNPDVRGSVMAMDDAVTSDNTAGGPLLVRTFVAILLDDAVRGALASAMDSLRPCQARVAWVPAGNLHLSAAFLGNVPRTMVGDLSAVLDETVAGVSPFAVRVRGVGTFGRRVVWAGVEAPRALFEIQGRVVEGVARLGVPGDKRPYKPHITLGRIRSGADDLSVRLRRLGSPDFGMLAVNEVSLMRSEMQPAHAVYSLLHAARLGGA